MTNIRVTITVIVLTMGLFGMKTDKSKNGETSNNDFDKSEPNDSLSFDKQLEVFNCLGYRFRNY